MATNADAGDLSKLESEILEVEFKHTLVAVDEAKVRDLFRWRLNPPKRRKVYFYDTRELALYHGSGLVLRARVTQNDDDNSTVKVRPAKLDKNAPWRKVDDVEIELDVSGRGPVRAAKLDATPKHGEIEEVEAHGARIGSLFTGKQKDLVKAYAPDADFDDLEVLGPVDARKWDFDHLALFRYTLSVEEWALPDTTRFIELSFKVKRKKAPPAQKAFAELLARLDVDTTGQEQKTPRVLEFFAERL